MVDEDRKKNRVSTVVPKEVGLPGTNKSMGFLRSTAKLTGTMSMSRMKMRRMSYGFGGLSGIKNDMFSPESPALSLRIADEMMRKVKNMCFNRYRIISVVTIGQKRAQSYNNAISFLWDHERDNYVDVHRECITNFIQVTIFGIYLD